METLPRILIVDDDTEIRTLLADYLDANGYRATAVPDGVAMARALADDGSDLVVLDLNLPGEDGLSLCRRLRATSSLPVIMLTARAEPLDRILGLEMGADDYLPKPFEPRELLARIRSVLRRSQGAVTRAAPARRHLHFAGWKLDPEVGHLIDAAGLVIVLSGAELRLLKVFLDHPKRVLNREQLLQYTQGRDAEAFDRSIDIQISRLRQKLNEDARAPQIIKTVRNGGYLFDAIVEAEARP
ncbi:MAG: response regulator [Proteobacteria bacterium]|nr:response regulator [Pseudomonadota bacterium]